jgi:uncharacterized protein YqjF (DUF2071 family)
MDQHERASMNGLEPITNSRPWVMSMRWENLAFLHWPAPIAALEAHIPKGLQLETFDGQDRCGAVSHGWRSCPRLA